VICSNLKYWALLISIKDVYIHRTPAPPHRKGEEPTRHGTYTVTTSIFESYIHTNMHDAVQVFETELCLDKEMTAQKQNTEKF
jgi:hypothetical protein